MKKVALIVLLLTINLACVRHKESASPTVAQDVTARPGPVNAAAVPSPTSRAQFTYVTDQANVFDAATRTQLESRLAQLRAKEDIDFAVVTVSTIGGESPFDHSLKLARERGAAIGNRNSNGNLLLLVAVDDRKWHIQISRNLEAELTKEVLTQLSSTMAELFQQKRYGEGITRYIDAIIVKLAELRSHSAQLDAKNFRVQA